MLNGPRVAVAVPSETVIWMPLWVPTCWSPGVPLMRPFDELKVAHTGNPETENDKALPSGSLAVGVKLYCEFALTDVGGVPEIVGGEFGTFTVIENAARLLEACPSDTRMTILENVPALAAVGVPLSRPFDELKLIQDGLPVIENVRLSPSGSDAVGVKE